MSDFVDEQRVPARPWRLSTSDFTVRVHEATAPCMKWHCMYVRSCLSVRPCPLTVNTYLLTYLQVPSHLSLHLCETPDARGEARREQGYTSPNAWLWRDHSNGRVPEPA